MNLPSHLVRYRDSKIQVCGKSSFVTGSEIYRVLSILLFSVIFRGKELMPTVSDHAECKVKK